MRLNLVLHDQVQVNRKQIIDITEIMNEQKNQLLESAGTDSDIQMSLASAEDFRFFAQRQKNASNNHQNHNNDGKVPDSNKQHQHNLDNNIKLLTPNNSTDLEYSLLTAENAQIGDVNNQRGMNSNIDAIDNNINHTNSMNNNNNSRVDYSRMHIKDRSGWSSPFRNTTSWMGYNLSVRGKDTMSVYARTDRHAILLSQKRYIIWSLVRYVFLLGILFSMTHVKQTNLNDFYNSTQQCCYCFAMSQSIQYNNKRFDWSVCSGIRECDIKSACFLISNISAILANDTNINSSDNNTNLDYILTHNTSMNDIYYTWWQDIQNGYNYNFTNKENKGGQTCTNQNKCYHKVKKNFKGDFEKKYGKRFDKIFRQQTDLSLYHELPFITVNSLQFPKTLYLYFGVTVGVTLFFYIILIVLTFKMKKLLSLEIFLINLLIVLVFGYALSKIYEYYLTETLSLNDIQLDETDQTLNKNAIMENMYSQLVETDETLEASTTKISNSFAISPQDGTSFERHCYVSAFNKTAQNMYGSVIVYFMIFYVFMPFLLQIMHCICMRTRCFFESTRLRKLQYWFENFIYLLTIIIAIILISYMIYEFGWMGIKGWYHLFWSQRSQFKFKNFLDASFAIIFLIILLSSLFDMSLFFAFCKSFQKQLYTLVRTQTLTQSPAMKFASPRITGSPMSQSTSN